jgi:hypothetical protein
VPLRVLAKIRERGCDLPRGEGGPGFESPSETRANLACWLAPTCSTGGLTGLGKKNDDQGLKRDVPVLHTGLISCSTGTSIPPKVENPGSTSVVGSRDDQGLGLGP